ncbi:MAG: transglycosylase SLT domain-containing protein [Candidatus Cryptobacteroides sp.]|nr:transglycosylase SLT domain-containing protein [Candidatus Cryptobacteroides sp.]
MRNICKLVSAAFAAFVSVNGYAQDYFDVPEIVSDNDSTLLVRAEAEFADSTMSKSTVDSLLLAYYNKHKNFEYASLSNLDTTSVRYTSSVPDSVFVQRLSDIKSFIPLTFNDVVKNYIILYSEKMPEKMGRVIGLGNYYFPIFQETFNRYDIPEELRAMAVIESMLKFDAVSRVGAKGMWQFMYQTAKKYGLVINSFVDERLDPVRAVDAAARYLSDSYAIFGDWQLAIASYNCGPGNVNKAIKRSGKTDIWDIYYFLPRETRGYVPAFTGALYALNYYKEHGIRPEQLDFPAQVDTFHIHKMLHFKQVSELAGVPLETIKMLNPQYTHEIIPGSEKESWILRLPAHYTADYIAVEDSVHLYKADTLLSPVVIKKIKDGGDGQRIAYKVKSGDTLGGIAKRYGCTVKQIQKWNHLKGTTIRIGQTLSIYRGGRR